MPIEAVVVNASPLITLFRSGQADLLPRLFKRIVVPQAVWQEVVQDAWDDPLRGSCVCRLGPFWSPSKIRLGLPLGRWVPVRRPC